MQKAGQLAPNQILAHQWEIISVDTIGGLPESRGYNVIQKVTLLRLQRAESTPELLQMCMELFYAVWV